MSDGNDPVDGDYHIAPIHTRVSVVESQENRQRVRQVQVLVE